MALYFTFESRDTLKSFTLFITVKTIAKLDPEHSCKFEIKISKISRRGLLSPDNAKCGHFTLLFCRGRQRNVPIADQRDKLAFVTSRVNSQLLVALTLNPVIWRVLFHTAIKYSSSRSATRYQTRMQPPPEHRIQHVSLIAYWIELLSSILVKSIFLWRMTLCVL